MPFEKLGLHEPVLSAIAAQGYTQPSPIQEQSIPELLKGRDMLGCAQTGTGKTAAFSLPIIQRFIENPLPDKQQSKRHAKPIRCLILSPTRELAIQLSEAINEYSAGSDIRNVVIYGGVKQGPQTKALRDGVDIVVATPGRLIDLMGQGHVDLSALEVFVLDEADRMLDMGFVDDIWQILSYVPEKRQSLLFSATMPQKIRGLADAILNDPFEVHIAPEMPAGENIEQRLYLVEWGDKTNLLLHLLEQEETTRVLIFTQTKRRADVLHRELSNTGLKPAVMHSDRSQSERRRAIEDFTSGKRPLLIASDIAARGLDVDDVSHVVNYELPQEAEVYVHRIGRTGRAGAKGVAMSFCCLDERPMLDDIEKILGEPIPLIEDHPFPSFLALKRKVIEDAVPKTGVRAHRVPGRRRRM